MVYRLNLYVEKQLCCFLEDRYDWSPCILMIFLKNAMYFFKCKMLLTNKYLMQMISSDKKKNNN